MKGAATLFIAKRPSDSISFSARGTLLGGNLNNVTSTKQNVTDQFVVMAEGGGKAQSVLVQIPVPVGAPANQGLRVQAGADQTIQLPSGATLHGTVTENGLPPAPNTVN